MDVGLNLAVDERLAALLKSLGISRVHIATGFAPNGVAMAAARPEMVASLSLICPMQLPLEPSIPADLPLLVVHGTNAAWPWARLRSMFGDVRELELEAYEGVPWSDVMLERGEEIRPAMLDFLSGAGAQWPVDPLRIAQEDGEVAGITYRIRGGGPPLLLLPLSLARSQWEPLVPILAQQYTTIVVGGAHLGVVPVLETRMRGGYQKVVRSVVDSARPQPTESVLEVGCGSGAVARWLAGYLPLDKPLTAVDVNSYLLHEAASLTRADGLSDRINYQEGDAEALPFASESFDVTLSFTVMEEVDADRMLVELLRVTRPGGRVGVVVRAIDLPRFLNVALSSELETRVLEISAPRVGVGRHGCADPSLYRRFVDAGLGHLEMGPQWASENAERSARMLPEYADRLAHALPDDDARQFREAIAGAIRDGTLIYAQPYHCAVGVRG